MLYNNEINVDHLNEENKRIRERRFEKEGIHKFWIIRTYFRQKLNWKFKTETNTLFELYIQ